MYNWLIDYVVDVRKKESGYYVVIVNGYVFVYVNYVSLDEEGRCSYGLWCYMKEEEIDM